MGLSSSKRRLLQLEEHTNAFVRNQEVLTQADVRGVGREGRQEASAEADMLRSPHLPAPGVRCSDSPRWRRSFYM